MGCRSRFSCLIGAIRQTGQGRAWSDGSCSSHGHGKLWAGKSRWTSRTGRPCAHGTCFACSSVSSDDCAHVRVRRLLHCVALRPSVSSAITDGTVTPALDDCASALCALDDCDARIGRLRVCALRIELRLQVVRAFAIAVVLVHVVCALFEVVVQGDCGHCASLIKCPS